MATVDISDLREHIETDAVDDVLTRLLNQAVTDVESRFGDDSARTDILDGGVSSVRLSRPASSVSSVTVQTDFTATATALTASDYVLLHGGRTLRRITLPNWENIVNVTFTPKTEENVRNMVIVELVRCGLTYQGLITREGVGDYSADLQGYTAERERIMQQLSNHRGFNFL